MKNFILLIALSLLTMTANASFVGFDASNKNLGHQTELKCSSNMDCSVVNGQFSMTLDNDIVGDGSGEIYGYRRNLIAATATTITVSQCGSVFYNSGAVEIELPEASAALGCVLTFVTANASNFDVDPDAADQILVLTNAAGDSIRNATLGNTVTLMAISASQWVVLGSTGTYTDNN